MSYTRFPSFIYNKVSRDFHRKSIGTCLTLSPLVTLQTTNVTRSSPYCLKKIWWLKELCHENCSTFWDKEDDKDDSLADAKEMSLK
jgi:hypothetical protein